MLVQVVDENDNFLLSKEEDKCDKNKEILRSSSLWVFDENKNLLIARRSKEKWTFPDIWGPSVQGTLEPDETYQSNVLKEAREELGLNLNNVILGPKIKQFDNHHFFNQYFFVSISSTTNFQIDTKEVGEVKWISFEELKKWHKNNPEQFLIPFSSSLEAAEQYLIK